MQTNTQRPWPRLALAALVAGTFAFTAQAQTTSRPTPATAGAAAKLDRKDESFLKRAAESGHTEIEGSKLAEKRASSAEVKTFAQQMIADHTKASEELKALAASKGVELPTGPSLMWKGHLKLLETSEGRKFDEGYANQVGVKAHEDTVELFTAAANESKDADVKAFATKTLPTLRQHLDHARQLKRSVGSSS